MPRKQTSASTASAPPPGPLPRRGLGAALRWPGDGARGLAALPPEALAALTLAAIALPEQMATARLMGLPPVTGLIAFLAGTVAFAVFGTHRTVSVGADSTIAPIMAAGLATLAATGSPRYAALAGMLAVMVGLVLIVARPLRLGWIADLLSIPVTTGFMAGIAVHIVMGALPAVLGVDGPGLAAASLPERAEALAARLPEARAATMALGFGVAGLSLLVEAWRPRLPGPLIALALATAAAMWMTGAGLSVPMMGALQIHAGAAAQVLPLHLPGWADLTVMLPLALIVALVVMMQTAAVLQSYPQGQATPADPDRDFAAVGAGSLIAGLTGSFAVNASPPRTAVVEEAGGRSQWSGLMGVAIALGVAALAAGVFAHVPRAALNGVLLMIGLRLLHPARLRAIWRASPGELPVVAATFALVIALPIMLGVGMAVVLALLHAVYTIARPHCTPLARVPGTTIWWSRPPDTPAEQEPGVLVFALGAPVNFLNARYMLGRLRAEVTRRAPRLLVIEASAVIAVDFTGARLFGDEIARLRAQGITVALARLESPDASEQARRTGLAEAIGSDRTFLSVEEAVRALRPEMP